MKNSSLFTFIILLISLLGCSSDNSDERVEAEAKIKGVDLSFLSQIEQVGIQFSIENQQKDALQILKEAGVNMIRFRIWHNPTTDYSSFQDVKEMSARAKQAECKTLLCVHYSDTWADPAHQQKPQAWQEANFENLKDSLYKYTQKLVKELEPDYIQIGNEINTGILFPDGSVNHFDQFTSLLESGISAVRATDPSVKIILHYAGLEGADDFFEKLNSLDYDLIALSYYPIWHGKNLNLLEEKMNALHQQFNRQIVIAETAYPFTLEWNDWTNNIVGSQDQIISEYPASEQGQKSYLTEIKRISNETFGAGFCYWGADYVAFDGEESKNGSSWENQALFDFENKALPALSVFSN